MKRTIKPEARRMKPIYAPIRALLAISLMVSYALPAQATLIDRGDGLIYDDELDITWVQIADLAAGSSFDDGGGTFGDSSSDGLLTWDNAVAWIDNLVFGGFADWRLPTMDANGDSTVVDCRIASEAACRDNELGYLYYHGLEGTGNPFFPLTGDQAPFTDILFRYWGSNEFALDSSFAWTFDFVGGIQGPVDKNGDDFDNPAGAWAVRSGDVLSSTPVPEPGTLSLLGAGLIGIGFARRRMKAR